MVIKIYNPIVLLKYVCIIALFCSSNFAQAQTKAQFTANTKQTFNAAGAFIENIGQYGSTYKGQEQMDSILFGFEGHDMPILFTKKGLIILQRRVEKISKAEEEKLEKQGVSEEVIEHKKTITDRAITMQWLNANPHPQIITEQKNYEYHTYGLLKEKAYGYKKITYKNLYEGIDLVYSFIENSKIGFEYSLHVAAGADIAQIKMRYGGDVKKIKTNKQGNLIIDSDIEGIQQSTPITFYNKTTNEQRTTDHGQSLILNSQSLITNSATNQSTNQLITSYSISKNEVTFTINENYDHTKPIVIDPFVSSTNNLDGLNAGKAKDIDYDYAGNVYVTGGGAVSPGNHRLAKYNAAGVLQWTFSGVLTVPIWEFGDAFGGWVVEKSTGNVYLGQGLDVNGFRVIRLNINGLYDNYITTADANFRENWKMYWSCNNGNPQILIAGGGVNSDINLGVIIPPSTGISSLNITGLVGPTQDIVDINIDLVSNDLYTLYASSGIGLLNNKIYKNAFPFSAATLLWNSFSGFNTLEEVFNRPYLTTNFAGANDNSANMLALNANYLFYWDGKNLKAFNKATGATVGTPLITSNTAKMSGGILADPDNNVYIGNVNGTISSYTFNGSTFDENGPFSPPTSPVDIPIIGYSTKSVYDLEYNEADSKIYACGDGFVASYNVGAFSGTTPYTLNVSFNCIAASTTATLMPTPPVGSTISYTLFNGATPISTNSTGIFTNLIPLTNYRIVATLNAVCSGSQVAKDFIVPGPTITTTPTNEICGNAAGQIVAVGSGTAAPYTYSINGTNFFASGTFTGLAANSYTITVRDGNGCKNTKQVVISNNSFTPTFLTTYSGTTCGNSTGTIDATPNGGVAPYQYSINSGATYQASNIFAGLAAGQYQLKVRDVNGCLSTTVLVDITPSFGVGVTALPTNSTCGLANGIITATPIGGAAPFQYSINGGTTYQPSNVFTGLLAGPYTIRIRDANTCVNNSTVITVANTAGATVSGVSTNSTCGFANGVITATPVGGTAPFQYSRDGGTTYQTSNIFTGLLAGPYTIRIRDANTCVNNSAVITVANTAGATVSGVSTNSTCGLANGVITATPVGGTAPFQYSRDGGTTFQTSNIFTGLLAGPYTIRIRDANSCVNNSAVITVANTVGATVSGVSTNSTCGFANGIITATPAGGTAPFQYSRDGGTTYQPSNIFTGLLAGPYTIRIRDGNSCVNNSAVITVSNTVGATVSGVSTNSTCGFANGIITATPAGGTAPFQYSRDGGTTFQTSNIFTGLLAGSYTIRIRDANTCLNNSAVITVANTSGATVLGVSTNSTCGFANGEITASPVGGTAPFQYSKDGGTTYQASNIFAGLLAGTYTITIKDGNSCLNNSALITVANTAGATVTGVSANSTCGFANGTITATPAGGTAPFVYSIDGGTTYQTSNIFTGLLAGTYTVKIKDGNSCLNNSALITAANTAGATVTGVSANSTCGFANGTITATPAGGTAPFVYSIDGGTTYQTSNIFTGLLAGSYTITIKDGNTCLNNSTAITVANTVGATVTAIAQDATCGNPNGKITVTGVGGTPPYTFSIDAGTTYQSATTFNNLAPLPYVVYIKDNNNCVTTLPIAVAAIPVPILNVFAGKDTSVVINQPLQLNAIDVNNIGFVSYTWSPSFGLNSIDIKTPIALLNRDFAYEVIATTADGCIATDSIKIKVTYLSDIFVPTAFTPNGDGRNDILRPKLIGVKELKYFTIYNRYGEKIYTTSKENVGWDGSIRGKLQNTGTYVWMAEAVDYKGQIVFRKGTTTLIK
jgi:gliding motility-associated-like protein